MPHSLSIAIAQINPIVGDIDGNAERLRRMYAAAPACDLVIAGELVLAGYPPEDLVLKRAFQDHIESAMADLARATAGQRAALLVGAPWRVEGRLFNAAVLLENGNISTVRLKRDLPNYGVFDEKRVFAAGPPQTPIDFRGARLGVMVCEDMWTPEISRDLAGDGADLLIVLNGSPFEVAKKETRRELAAHRCAETHLPLIYVNIVGGQDELVFDGASFALAADGAVCARLHPWREEVAVTEWHDGHAEGWRSATTAIAADEDEMESIYQAMVLGLRDYVTKNHFPGVVIGLSGGIDSALTAVVAVDALGADRVRCVMMPSPYTSQDSLDDAAEQAKRVAVRLHSVTIAPAMQAFQAMLEPLFEGRQADTTEENIQSRSRGLVLMAISNKFGEMLLTTGNKSEMSVGYATLYGDMCGGYSVLKDVYKTTVYELARWRNVHLPKGALGPSGTVVPERIIAKAPTAELKTDQTDQDTLPPYPVLDDILVSLIEDEASLDEIVARGHDPALVRRVWAMVDRAEYKRRQAPPGVKITRRAFGRDRRYPITNAFTRLI